MEYADPENPSRRYVIGRAGKQQMPNGDWVLTPLDVATAERYGLKPVVVQTSVLGADERLGGETVTVEADRILVRREKRRKTVDEQEKEVRAGRDLYAEMDEIKSRLAALEQK